MNPADEQAAKIEPSVAGSHDVVRLRATLNNHQRISLQSKPAEDLHSLIAKIDRHLDHETSERTTIYDRFRAIDGQMKELDSQTKRRASGVFGRYLVAICIGVAGTLAWQPYADATKQIIATRAPELGWSPEAKQMITNWVQQLGWTKSPAGPDNTAAQPSVQETQVATVAEIVPTQAPAVPSLDPEQVQQITQRLALLQQTVERLAATQDQMEREITRLQAAQVQILLKLPAPPPPPAAPARKPIPTAQSSSRTPPPRLPPHP